MVRAQVCFSFDTTGSMSRCIEEVRKKIKQLLSSLFQIIPDISIAVVAHGDYCDETFSYVYKFEDFCKANRSDRLRNFVDDVEDTGGGDPDECYELILHEVQNLSWENGCRGVLVMIGDAGPHEASYRLNVKNLDWREEAKKLYEQMGIRIYGVQCQPHVFKEYDDFWAELALIGNGGHIHLEKIDDIVNLIKVLCMAESNISENDMRRALQRDDKLLGNTENSTVASSENIDLLIKNLKTSNPRKDIPTVRVDQRDWRPSSLQWTQNECTKLREAITEKKPQKGESYKFLLVGDKSAGKSSAINTFYAAFCNEPGQLVDVVEEDKSAVQKVRIVKFSETFGEANLPITICDMIGFGETIGPTLKEIVFILDGNIRDSYEFDARESIKYDNEYFNKCPSQSDKIQVVVFTISASSDFSPEMIQRMTDIKRRAYSKSIRCAVLVTNIDKTCPDVNNDLSLVHQSEKVGNKVKTISEALKIDKSNIFPIQNYSEQVKVDNKINILALETLRQIQRTGDNALEDQTTDFHVDKEDTEPLLVVPFRDAIYMEMENNLLSEINDLKTTKEGDLRVAFMGPKSSGKSSVINSIHSVIKRSVYTNVPTGRDTSPTTKSYQEYLPTANGQIVPLTLIDTMGFMDENQGLNEVDVGYILDGKVPLNYEFSSTDSIREKQIMNQGNGTQVHLLCLVVSATELGQYSSNMITKLLDTIDETNSPRSIPTMVLLTHIDEICPYVSDDPAQLPYSPNVLKCIEKVQTLLQVQRTDIFPVSNFTGETRIQWQKSVLILQALQHMKSLAASSEKSIKETRADLIREYWRPSSLQWTPDEYRELGKMMAQKKRQSFRLLLVGEANSGKSSVINTFYAALQNELGELVHHDYENESVTKKVIFVKLAYLPITVCDTMGFEEIEGPTLQDFVNIMDGKINEDPSFDSKKLTKYMLKYFIRTPSQSDKVQVVFVISATSDLSQEMISKMITIRQRANSKGIRCAVLVTKIDIACPEVNDDLSVVYCSETIRNKVETISENLMIDESDIFPMQNYSGQDEVNYKINILALDNLRQILCSADNALEDEATEFFFSVEQEDDNNWPCTLV